MGDLVKIGVKAGLIAVLTLTIIGLFIWLPVPTLDFTSLAVGIGKAQAIIYHYVPGASFFLPLIGVLLGANLAFLVADGAFLLYRWIMKVNE